MRKLLLAIMACVPCYAACPNGYVQVTGTLNNPDGSGFTGRLIPSLGYVTPIARENHITITVTAGAMTTATNGGLVCLAPGNYTVANYVSGSTLSYPTYWAVPSSGPVAVTDIEVASIPSPSLAVNPSWISAGSNGQCMATTGGVASWGACIVYDVAAKATATGAVTTTTLATCPAGTSKFCQYAYWASIECTDLSHLSATGTVSMTFTYVDGSGSSISTAPANTVLSTCVSTSANAKVAMVGPGQLLTYSINAGTGTYSVDYGITILRIQ